MEKQRTKLGARILSDQEMELILPNARLIYEQIEVFRNNISDDNSGQYEYEQKTNNIGIMGCRGAGKTSVLRTIHRNLSMINERKEESSHRDVILPIIVPENMSSGLTLMDVVLGMLKGEIEKRTSATKRAEGGGCIYTGRNVLEREYNETVKKYCYIKKDYRDILIQQFTTEQYYVDKTKEVFNSDTEFIKQFNKFVKLLLEENKDSNESSMLFLFIDDIDLSTTKCTDIVKTLISYLSNSRIVSFISGDIHTFEEALTLDFLRKEKTLDDKLFHNTYYSTVEKGDSKNLLERKKILAYEYLKKVIPPAYRRSIKQWALDERGAYQITDEGGRQQKSLSELLMELTKEQLKEAYFVYKEENEDGIENKLLNVTFHMFDNTSRGLNNVYNVLQELYEEKVKKSDGFNNIGMWRLIEAIVDSKPLYAKYREQLLEQIIIREKEIIKIDFESALNWLCDEHDFSSQERFKIFLLIDFVGKLFVQSYIYDNNYNNLKNNVIEDYINDESIDGKIVSLKYPISFNAVEKNIGNDTKKYQEDVGSILLDLLMQGEFIFDLYLIKYLGRSDIYDILRETFREPDSIYKVAYAFTRTIWALRETEEERKDYLAYLCCRMPNLMGRLLGKLPLKSDVIYGQQLLDDIDVSVSGLRYMVESSDLSIAYYKNAVNYCHEVKNGSSNAHKRNFLWSSYCQRNIMYWIYYDYDLREKKRLNFDLKKMANNLAYRGLAKALMKQMKPVITSYKVGKLNESNYFLSSLQEEVINEIDKKDLWDNPFVINQVVPYIKNKKIDFIWEIVKGRVVFDASEIFDVQGVYTQFKNCYKGSSRKALVKKLEGKLSRIFSMSVRTMNIYESRKYYMSLEQVLIIQCLLEEFLYNHPRIQYGKKEVRKLLMGIQELPIVIRFKNDSQTNFENIWLEWNEIQNQLEERQKIFFHKFVEWLKENKRYNSKTQIEYNELYDRAVKIIDGYPESFTDEDKKFINDIDLNVIQGIRDKKILFLLYISLNLEIESLKNEFELSNEPMIDYESEWERMEQPISEPECIFYLQSYLRYLQSSEKALIDAGIRAEKIEMLVEYILDSERIADERIYSDAYELICRELDLTEEDFESLFTSKDLEI